MLPKSSRSGKVNTASKMRREKCQVGWVRLVFGAVFVCEVLLPRPPTVRGCPSSLCVCYEGIEIDCTDMELDFVPHWYPDPHNESFTLLDLGKNKLKRIGPYAFEHLRVRKIKMVRNRRAVAIHPKAFRNVWDMVTQVQFRQNKFIPELPRGLFRDMKKLKKIDMSDNGILDIRRGAFKGASNVEYLDATYNELSFLESNVFGGLESLGRLLLSNNDIELIDSRAFNSLTQLDILYLKSNKIRDLQPRTFAKLMKLRELDLSENRIPALFPLMFKGLSTLEHLDLSENEIIMIADGTFQSMSSLKELILEQNQLVHIGQGIFLGLSNLEILDLQENGISGLRDGVFRSLPKLRKIQLDMNKLTTVNPCAFANLTGVEEIWVMRNHIHCDCMLKWTSLPKFPHMVGKCSSPRAMEGQEIGRAEKYSVCHNGDHGLVCDAYRNLGMKNYGGASKHPNEVSWWRTRYWA